MQLEPQNVRYLQWKAMGECPSINTPQTSIGRSLCAPESAKRRTLKRVAQISHRFLFSVSARSA